MNVCVLQAPWVSNVRDFSSKAPLTLDLIQQRVLLVLKLYDKINPEKVREHDQHVTF